MVGTAVAATRGRMEGGEMGRVERCRRSVARIAVMLAIGIARSAGAEVDAEIRARLQALEEEVALLKRQLAVKEEKEEKDGGKASLSPVASAGPDGFVLQSADKKSYRVTIRGYVQTDGRFFEEGEQPSGTDSFLLRRVRPIVEGTVGEYIGFQIMPDFGQGQSILQDAYATLNYWDFAQIWGGKYKAPVGLERLRSARELTFIERAFPTRLVPNHDIGFMLQGDPWEGLLTYQIGVFNGATENASVTNADTDTNDGKSIDARVFAHPFTRAPWEWLRGVGVGIAGTWGHEFPNLPTYASNGNQTFFSFNGAAAAVPASMGLPGRPAIPAVAAIQDHWRVMPQGYYYYGPFGLLWEYVTDQYTVARGGPSTNVGVQAWQLAASYILTGENAGYKGFVPRSPLRPDFSGLGAFEIAARYSAWRIDEGVFPFFANPDLSARAAGSWTVGLNWYLNRFLKLQLNYERTTYEGGAPGGSDRTPEGVVLTRMQVAY